MSCSDALAELLRGRKVAVLTGAGCSTDSGIPDYRGPETRRRARNPVQYQAFISDPVTRQRYWARAVVGWPKMKSAQPNVGHRALAALEERGVVSGLVTQNVDRLHHAGGSRRVVELHGTVHEVVCLGCGEMFGRDLVQARFEALNPGWADIVARSAPDGDAELAEALTSRFELVSCERCDGVLKPHVVFFGETVPLPVTREAFAILDEAEILLVVGSSLTVFSGYRFVRAAKKQGKPVAIVNLGPTRGDADATLKVDAPIGDVLPRVLESF